MRLTDLLSGLNALKDNADQRYVLIRRERFPDRHVSALSADAVQAFQAPESSLNPVLQSRDRIIVIPLQSDRGVALADVLQELRAQSRDKASPPVVSIIGRTRAPGDYPLEPGMRISDLIRAGGGLDDSAYALDAELTRFDTDSSTTRRTRVIPIDLAAVLRNAAEANVQLLPYDVMAVKEIPDWSTQGAVTLTGEVRFPGRYLISKGETLSAVVRRAGGLTEYAFPAGTTFTREEIREQERRQIDTLAKRMQTDLTTLALQNARTPQSSNQGDALAAGESLLTQLRSTQPVGRLVINVQRALSVAGSSDDVQLRAGDTLAVPRLRQYVTVIGEVQNPTSLICKQRLTRDQYIELTGGTTPRADKRHIYVVRADGSVVVGNSGLWFRRRTSTSMHTGDTIVVPFDAEKMRPLPMWQAITTILYNIAIATAAVHAL
jgi:protein involved in polysaccharide export with SLBB domain